MGRVGRESRGERRSGGIAVGEAEALERAREVRRGMDRDVAVGQEVDVDAERVQSRIVCPAMSVESDEFKIEDESTIPWD